MPISYVTDAGTLTIPGAYSTLKVDPGNNGGLATTGVLMLVGEADAGPDFTKETDLGSNAFGPDQFGDVVAKYKGGRLVNAFRDAIAAASDPDIQGSFSRAILVKTNPSAKAGASLAKWDSTTWGNIEDRSYGRIGNLINFQVVAKQAEVVPSTGIFSLVPPIAATNVTVRVNGGAAQTLTLAALATPTAMVAQFAGLTGIAASGGVDRGIIDATTGTLAMSIVSGNQVQITRSTNFGAIPLPGDVVYVSGTSVLASVHANNAGSYIVTGATATVISCTKVRDVTGASGALTAPSAQSALSIVSLTADARAFSQVTIGLNPAVNPIDGAGKALEIADPQTNTGHLADCCFLYNGTAIGSVTWMSNSATPNVNFSSAEYIAQINAARGLDNLSESLADGGAPLLLIGYKGTTASAVIDSTYLTITVTGGAGTSPPAIRLADYDTIADLVTYLNTLLGFTAAAGTAVLSAQKSTTLDQGTYTFATTFGGTAGRIKQDAYKFYNRIATDGVLVELSAQPVSGLPAPTSGVSFLSGGSKGATTDAIVSAAFDALALVRGNFLVPIFSRDATSDIADEFTDVSSSYTITGIHAYAKSHVLKMSTLKARRNRQAFLSYRGTFNLAKQTAANMAHPRISMTFQDIKDTGSNGIVQFQPWMGAVKAASMQAAGFYRAIFRKGINISGALQAAGDFNDQNDSQKEDGLTAGLLMITRAEDGTWYFVSDQTTYGKDSNFVFNSIQAMYAGDVIALTTAQRMEKAFVGQSVADISQSLATHTLESIMEDLRRLKLIAASDDAPRGFRNPKVKIQGPAMVVSIEVKLAGAIYFIPIYFSITQVQQSA